MAFDVSSLSRWNADCKCLKQTLVYSEQGKWKKGLNHQHTWGWGWPSQMESCLLVEIEFNKEPLWHGVLESNWGFQVGCFSFPSKQRWVQHKERRQPPLWNPQWEPGPRPKMDQVSTLSMKSNGVYFCIGSSDTLLLSSKLVTGFFINNLRIVCAFQILGRGMRTFLTVLAQKSGRFLPIALLKNAIKGSWDNASTCQTWVTFFPGAWDPPNQEWVWILMAHFSPPVSMDWCTFQYMHLLSSSSLCFSLLQTVSLAAQPLPRYCLPLYHCSLLVLAQPCYHLPLPTCTTHRPNPSWNPTPLMSSQKSILSSCPALIPSLSPNAVLKQLPLSPLTSFALPSFSLMHRSRLSSTKETFCFALSLKLCLPLFSGHPPQVPTVNAALQLMNLAGDHFFSFSRTSKVTSWVTPRLGHLSVYLYLPGMTPTYHDVLLESTQLSQSFPLSWPADVFAPLIPSYLLDPPALTLRSLVIVISINPTPPCLNDL